MNGSSKKLDINWITNAWIEKVTQNEIYLKDGKTIPFKFAIIIPPFKGVQAIRDSPGLGHERGFIPVNSNYQHKTYENIYAARVAVSVRPSGITPVPCGVPKTGYMSEVMAKVAAHNIIYDIIGEKKREELPFRNIRGICIMDACKQGVVMVSDHLFAPRKYELLNPGTWSHWAKIIFERYYVWKLKKGLTYLP